MPTEAELLITVLNALLAGAGQQLGAKLYAMFMTHVGHYFRTASPEDFAKFGRLSQGRIRQIVQAQLVDRAKLPASEREQLVALLVNFARGARLATSQGTVAGGMTGSQKQALVGEIMSRMQPKRAAGQPVEKNSDWILEQFLGAGTFGEVWLGHHKSAPLLKHAFKFFVNDQAANWLEQEANNIIQWQAHLHDDPHIVHLINVVAKARPYPYLTLDYVAGGSLEDWIMEAKEFRLPLQPYDLMEGITRALAKAHENRIFHRDLKPANVLLTEEGVPKISDFGLADIRSVDTDALRRSVYATHAAAQVGTPMYWPPEAWLPFAERNPAQDDVFAIGVIWYQLLVEKLERPPYDFAEVLRDAGQDPHTIDLISRCLAGPGNRFKDAIALADEMTGVDIPEWKVPPGMFDVQHLARDFVMQKL